MTWYRIQHHGQYPPWYRPYPYPVVVPVVIPQPVPTAAPAVDPAPQATKGMIRVLLPEAKADVALDGQLVAGLGSKRWLTTSPQVAGQQYTYTVTAAWQGASGPVTQERTVTVPAGQYGFVDFTRPAAG